MNTKEYYNEPESAASQYAGVAVDIACDDAVSETMVEEETLMLNNNPRNDE